MNYQKHLENIAALQSELEADRNHFHHDTAITRCLTLSRSLRQAEAADETNVAVKAELDQQIEQAAKTRTAEAAANQA